MECLLGQLCWYGTVRISVLHKQRPYSISCIPLLMLIVVCNTAASFPKKTIWSHNTVIPPKMFSCVLPDVYRSNLFGSESFSFIESLKLKSIVYLGNETLDEEWVAFCEESNISVVRFQP